MPTLELDEDFNSGFTGYAVVGGAAVETVAPIHGAKSFRFSGTGTAYIKRSVPTTQTGEVFRFLYRHDATPSGGSANIYSIDTAAGKNFAFRVTTSDVIQALVTGGGTAQNGPTLTVGATYLIEGKSDCSTGTFTLDWRVAGSAQTQATYVNGAPSTLTYERVGQVNPTPTANGVIDSLAISRVFADYPLGAPAAVPMVISCKLLSGGTVVRGQTLQKPGLQLHGGHINLAGTATVIHAPQSVLVGYSPLAKYTGARGVAVRTTSADVTAIFAARPWLDIASAYTTWKALQPTYSGGLTASVLADLAKSFKYCIDHPGKYTALRIEMGTMAPSYIYSTNATGLVQKIRVYTGTSDTTGAVIPVPWDANLRKHVQRLLPLVKTFLDTTYNGKKYADVCAFIACSMPTTVGTEMTIGDAGDTRNTTTWNALGTVDQRRQWYEDAWFNNLVDTHDLVPTVCPSIVNGTAWGDKRQASKNVALRASRRWTSVAERARILMGPSDMRVDKPGANSYRAWSADAADALLYVANVGLTPWAQSAAQSWFTNTGFNIPTADAVKKAYLDNACNIYRAVFMESNTSILGSFNLDSWAQNTLAPTIKALATPSVIAAAPLADAPTVRGGYLQHGGVQTISAARITTTAVTRGALLSRKIDPTISPAVLLVNTVTMRPGQALHYGAGYGSAQAIPSTAVLPGGTLQKVDPPPATFRIIAPCYTQTVTVSSF